MQEVLTGAALINGETPDAIKTNDPEASPQGVPGGAGPKANGSTWAQIGYLATVFTGAVAAVVSKAAKVVSKAATKASGAVADAAGEVVEAVGDAVSAAKAAGGGKISWDAARKRYWKQHAPDGRPPTREVLVKDNKTGRVYPRTETKELHHTEPQRDGGSHDHQPCVRSGLQNTATSTGIRATPL